MHEKKPKLLPQDFALSLDNIGELYLKTNRIKEAIVHYKKALKIMESLKPKNSTEYQREQFSILNNLANAYKEMNMFTIAEKNYENALVLSRRLVQENASKYRADLALILFNLSLMYNVNKKFKQSETTFSESLSLTKQLAKENPAVYKEELVYRLHVASSRYLLSGKVEKSEDLLAQSLKLSEELFKKNPNLYASLFSFVLYKKGLRMSFAYKPKEALLFYKKALKIIEELKGSNPDLFQEQSGEIYLSLSSIYHPRLFKPKKAEVCILKALDFYTLLAKKHPQKFNKKLADTLVALAGFYLLQNKVDNAEMNYLKSVELYRALAKENPKQYNEAFITTLLELADFYKTTKALKKAKEILEEALALQRKIVKKYPLLLVRVQLSQVLWASSLLYWEGFQEMKKAETFMLESLDILESVVEENASPIFLKIFSEHLNALSLLYTRTKKLEKAEDILLNSLVTNKKLLKLDAKIYKIDLARNFNELASLYKRTKRLEKAKKYYLKSLKLFNEIDDNMILNRFVVESTKSDILQALAKFEQKENNSSKAESYYLSSLEISRGAVKMISENQLAFGKNFFKLQKNRLAQLLITFSQFYLDQGKRAEAKEYYLEGVDLTLSLLEKGKVDYRIDYALVVVLGVGLLGLPRSTLDDAKEGLTIFKGEKGVNSMIEIINDISLNQKK
jgi:tetratricopeptide (TPR) repeat protein